MRALFVPITVLLLTVPASAEPLIFQGFVEASRTAELSSRIDGVVTEILFEGGERVEADQPMIRLDPLDAELALAEADARLASVTARLTGATRQAMRQEELFERGISPEAVVGPARTAKAAAEAEVALAKAERRRAALDLERTVITAPITGFIEPPATAVGAFLEAEAGPPLARIVAIDPALIAYRVPYATRLEVMAEAGASSLEELFQRIDLTIILPGDRVYPHQARPERASTIVDPTDGTIMVRAHVPNPDAVLRPGMTITVQSLIQPAETTQ